MNVTQRIAKNILSLFAGQAASAVLSLVLSILIARTLGDSDFGKFAFAAAFTTIFSVFIELGYTTLLIRDVSQDKSLAGKYFGNIVSIRLIFSVVVFTTMAIIINILGYPGETKLLVYCLGFYHILTSFATICRSIFRAFEKMEYELVTTTVREILRTGLGVSILLLGYGLRELALVLLFPAVMDVVLSFTLCSRKFVKPRIELDLQFFKQTMKIVIPLTLLSMFDMIFVRIDTVMLSAMKSDDVVGWYNAAYNVVFGLKPFQIWFLNGIFPLGSVYFVSSISLFKGLYEKALKYLLILVLPMAIGLAILSDRIVIILYSEDFANSASALRILTLDLVLIYFYGTLGGILVVMGKQNQMAITAGICAVLNIAINFILIPLYSYNGAAIATVITETVLLGIYICLVSRYLGRLPLHRFIVSPLISCAIMAVVIHILSGLNIAFLAAIGAIIYFIVLYLTKGLSSEDIDLLRELIMRPKTPSEIDRDVPS